MTLQTLRRVKEPIQAMVIEPQPRNVEALKHNCAKYVEKGSLEIYPAGLGDSTCEIQIFTDVNNSGSGTFIRPINLSVEEANQMSVISSKDFETDKLLKYKKYAIKSDIEGWDAKVLGSFSREFWLNVETAVIEVSSNPNVDSLDYLLSELINFEFLSWDPFVNQKLSEEEITLFWQSPDPGVRNLYARRSL